MGREQEGREEELRPAWEYFYIITIQPVGSHPYPDTIPGFQTRKIITHFRMMTIQMAGVDPWEELWWPRVYMIRSQGCGFSGFKNGG